MKKDFLFYAANFDPEINRAISSFKKGEIEMGNIFKEKTLKILEGILNSEEITSAGKEEWSVVRNLVLNLENNGEKENRILSVYGIPFSIKFSNQFI